MAGARQPIELLQAKGKKHLTKAEIAHRKATEVKAPSDNVAAPSYLSAKQKREFDNIASQLVEIGIMSNLDCDAVARYIVAKDTYLKCTNLLKKIINDPENINAINSATKIQDRMFKQCQSAAKELGLTISSRCKLVMPTVQKEEKENKFEKFWTSDAG